MCLKVYAFSVAITFEYHSKNIYIGSNPLISLIISTIQL